MVLQTIIKKNGFSDKDSNFANLLQLYVALKIDMFLINWQSLGVGFSYSANTFLIA